VNVVSSRPSSPRGERWPLSGCDATAAIGGGDEPGGEINGERWPRIRLGRGVMTVRKWSEMLDVLVESESSSVQIFGDVCRGFSEGEGGWTLTMVQCEG
jgi:hypothetical protein